VPDAVILLEPRVTPPSLQQNEEVKVGDIGVTFYDYLYSNKKTKQIFG
jgi:hypothetical protein